MLGLVTFWFWSLWEMLVSVTMRAITPEAGVSRETPKSSRRPVNNGANWQPCGGFNSTGTKPGFANTSRVRSRSPLPG